MPTRQVDGWGHDEMVAPEIRLVQKTSGGAAETLNIENGHFFNVMTQEDLGKEIEIVIVDLQKVRTYWGTDEIGDNPPQCSSSDAKSMVSASGENCAECPYRVENPWALPADERRGKCLPSYNILGLLLTEDMPLPFIMRVSGISSRSVQALYTRFRLGKSFRDPKSGAILFHIAKVEVKSVVQKTPYGDSYALHFGEITLFNDAPTTDLTLAMSKEVLGSSIALPEAGKTKEKETIPEKTETKPGKSETIPLKTATKPTNNAPATKKMIIDPEADAAAAREKQKRSSLKVVEDQAETVETTSEPEETANEEQEDEQNETETEETGKMDLDI
jgi:hypothetical protein